MLLIATGNPGKFSEIAWMLSELSVELVSLRDFSNVSEAVENGATFEENARIKALHYAGQTGVMALADDSGLEVDALGGAPGIHSAYYAGTHGDDAANNAKLIRALADVPSVRRTARFRCVVALAKNGDVLATADGSFEGLIVDSPLGQNGFGYDPHFRVPELDLTAAQLPAEQKNRISHRARAIRALIPELARIVFAK